jgi:hypothetical protein
VNAIAHSKSKPANRPSSAPSAHVSAEQWTGLAPNEAFSARNIRPPPSYGDGRMDILAAEMAGLETPERF